MLALSPRRSVVPKASLAGWLIPCLLVASLAGCESEINTLATPARPVVGPEAGVRAILTPGAGGTVVTIDSPEGLPALVRQARDLKVAVGGQSVVVSRPSGGHYTFTVPSGARLEPDVAGNWEAVFIADERESQIVTLQSGSPLPFGDPAVLVEPSPAFLVRGMPVKLRANTTATPEQYQFTWSYSTTGTAPWLPIPSREKEAEWTPAQGGNYFVRIDAVDRKTQRAYTTVTGAPIVFVTESKGVITTTPPRGGVTRGQSVRLTFTPPAGLAIENPRVSWSYAASPQGPWSAIAGAGTTLDWLPAAIGSWYLKADVLSPTTGAVASFISPEAAVVVSEATGLISATPGAVERGDRVALQLNMELPGAKQVTWYYARTGASAAGLVWVPMLGTGRTNDLVVNEAGTYSFRADVPEPNGSVRTFTTTDPVVSVTEGASPLITTDPPQAVVPRGANVTLKLNARGVDEDRFTYLWYTSTNPLAGWTAIQMTDADDAKRKSFTWETQQTISVLGTTSVVLQPPGAYFIRVDAFEKVSPNRVYTFTSSTPLVTIENR
ncbi:MAG: hypothetical protein VKP62_14120 [Candidatus Sericytochromatia bacterium]|nr:hypothetical protein [Candidatus Sericytochromatia bacterium]